MLFYFTNISAKISLDILTYSFCAEHHILVHFLPNGVAIKSIENYPGKNCSAFGSKNIREIDPRLTKTARIAFTSNRSDRQAFSITI